MCSGCLNGLVCQVDADCQSSFCDEGVCQPCGTHADCGADEQCDLVVGTCIPKSADGAACDEVENCVSEFCVDGVCCDTECDGTCEACTNSLQGVGGVTGTCGAIHAGDDPELECDADECKTGACDGKGACGNAQLGVACGDSPQCSGNTAIFGDVCDGQGQCTDTGFKGCGAYVCTPGPQCLAFCMTDLECYSSNDYCSTGFQCVPKLLVGQPCGLTPSECLSGFCVDGVCCNSACGDTCLACDVQGQAGTCTPVPAGQQDVSTGVGYPTCSSATHACDGVGQGVQHCKVILSAPCTYHSECIFGFCAVGSPGKSCKLGSANSCSANSDCASGSCVLGHCAAGVSGTPCHANTDCAGTGCNPVLHTCN